MEEYEKAMFAIWLTKKLLFVDKKILAIAAIKRFYNCGLKDAKGFVESIQTTAEQEFIKAVMAENDGTPPQGE